MATIKIVKFGGIRPRYHATALADGMAVVAHNCRLKNGKLVPLRQPSKLVGEMVRLENGLGRIADARSLFVWRRGRTTREFLAFPGRVYMAEGNLADDIYYRAFITGDTGLGTEGDEPCVYLSNDESNSIIRHPIAKDPPPALRVRLADGGLQNPDQTRYTYFFQTYVDPYGYESGCSVQSISYKTTCRTDDGWNIVTSAVAGTVTCERNGEYVTAKLDHAKLTWDGEQVVEAVIYDDTDLEYNDGDAVIVDALSEDEVPEGGGTVSEPRQGYVRRLYKVVTGTSEASVQFVAEFADDPWGQHTVTVKDEDAGETLVMMESAPRDLRYMTFVPGGFYVGFSPSTPKTVRFSEVDIPTDWPTAYCYDIKDNIVGVAVTSNSVFVLTDGFPWIFTGTAPDGMTCSHIAGPAACVSERSICILENKVFFASNEGVCTIYNDANEGTICRNLTESIFTKEQWQALNPQSCLMGQYDGALHCFFTLADGSKRGYIIDLHEGESAVSTHDEESTCLCVDNERDALYFVRETEEE